jgi:hypothetical protein
MAGTTGSAWLPRSCFWLAIGTAGLLIACVFLAPVVDRQDSQPQGIFRVITLFARDPVMRRTALAGAIGLFVTACVFFRPTLKSWALRSRHSKPPPPPINVVGA